MDCTAVAGPVTRNYRQGMALRIGLPETSRRAFWARLYARRRLRSEVAAPFASTHYALIGEKRGYRPNAFFDPHYFPRSRERRPKLRPRPARRLSRSSRSERAFAFRRIRPRLVRLAESGLDGAIPIRSCTFSRAECEREGGRGRISILNSCATSSAAQRRSLEAAAYRVFDRTPCDGELEPPLNREELRARQDRFYADGRLRIEREAGRTGAQRPRLRPMRSGLRRKLSRKSRAASTFS